MTQKELRKEIVDRLHQVFEYAKTNENGSYVEDVLFSVNTVEEMMQLINQHVKEVIGEAPPVNPIKDTVTDMGNHAELECKCGHLFYENLLAEQRKRAGLKKL